MCKILYKTFSPKWSFVGFYDHHPNGGTHTDGKDYSPENIYIGEWESETIDPTDII